MTATPISEIKNSENNPENMQAKISTAEGTPLVIASSNPQVVRVTLEAQGTLLYNAEKKFALE
jgi:CO dehydrogenase/acetyl-CoA synthase gamma subunit (corrinoid Fe-S protein)